MRDAIIAHTAAVGSVANIMEQRLWRLANDRPTTGRGKPQYVVPCFSPIPLDEGIRSVDGLTSSGLWHV